MRDRAAAAIQTHKMLGQGDRVLAAVSGGADSVALLHFLMAYCERNNIYLGALHFNHRLRGEESERDEAFVRALCGRWGVDLVVESADVAAYAAAHRIGLEEAGRACRYRFFEREAARQSARVATAHNQNDNAETLLLNLIRGASLRGLGGIPPVRGRFIRPLLDCSRAAIEAYLAAEGLDWVEDSSNRSDDFARNRVRHRLLPLCEEANPRFVQSAGRLARELREDEGYLERAAGEALSGLQRGMGWDREGFLRLPPVLRRHGMAALLRGWDIPISRERLYDVIERIEAARGAVQLSARWRLRCNRRQFFLEDSTREHSSFEHVLRLKQVRDGVVLPLGEGKSVHLSCALCQKNEINIKFPANKYKNALDCDRMGEIASLRQRRPGDRLRPAGTMHARTLKNLFQEAGIPPGLRGGLLVVAGPDGAPRWVEGIGPDASVAVGPDTERILHITLVEETDAF